MQKKKILKKNWGKGLYILFINKVTIITILRISLNKFELAPQA